MRRHVSMNHKRSEFARWDRGVYTDTCESLFGLFKRAIVGHLQWIGAKHLRRYGVEREFRWNTRKADIETRICRRADRSAWQAPAERANRVIVRQA